ncbi:MAG: tetratricopeptide repeat protein [Lachnospiraceae bacterium]|nr:tetratricopeptide repeat protein [Lachnospiraceae bacterium]
MKKLQYIIYAILLLVIVGLVAFDYYPDQTLDQNTITRAALLFIGTLLSIVKTATRSNREVSNKKATYSKAYPEFIGNAFSHSPKLEKSFYDALDDFNNGRYASAIKKFEKLRLQCQTTDDIYAVTTFQAICYNRLQHYQKAIELYQDATHLRPNSTLISNMGNCYSNLGLPEEAVDSYHQAIKVDPQNILPYNNLAQLYVQMGEYTKAADFAKQALNINAKYPLALSAMAISSYMLGDMDDYESYYRLAVANGYDGNVLKEYIRSLDSTV